MTVDQGTKNFIRQPLQGLHVIIHARGPLRDPVEALDRLYVAGALFDFQTVAIDLTLAVPCAPAWFRFFRVMSLDADDRGKSVVLIGLDEFAKRTIEQLALTDKLRVADTLEQAWTPPSNH